MAVRIKGDFGFSDDKAFVVSPRLLDVLTKDRIGGFELLPVGREGWSVLGVTRVVAAKPSALKTSGRSCREWGRPAERFGVYNRMAQLTLPKLTRSFFRPDRRRCSQVVGRRLEIADPYVTGDVISNPSRASIRGGGFRKLMSEAEWKTLLTDHKQCRTSKYPDSVLLR